MDPVRKILLLGGESGARDKTGLHAIGEALRFPSRAGDIGERQRAIGAGDRKDALLEIDVGLGGFEQMRGDRLRLIDDPLGREIDRRAAQGRRARATAALADRDLLGIALDVMHLVGTEAEPVADELLIDRLVPHALSDRARNHRHGAAAVEAQFGGLKAARRGALDRVGKAEATQFAAAMRLGAAPLEPGGVGEL